MTYIRKGYINIAPTGHICSFTERQNFPYIILSGLIPPCNIVIPKKCSGWGSPSFFIKPKNSDNAHQNNDTFQSIFSFGRQ